MSENQIMISKAELTVIDHCKTCVNIIADQAAEILNIVKDATP